MLNKITKLFLVTTSIAPIFLTLWFIEFSKNWKWNEGLYYLFITLGLTILCYCLIKLSEQRLEKIPVKITSMKTADKEVVGFILVYLLPLINPSALNVNSLVLFFVAILVFAIVFTTNSYHFNPLIGFIGYHFYEVTIEGEITFVLITKKNITNCKNVKTVVQVSEYMMLEA